MALNVNCLDLVSRYEKEKLTQVELFEYIIGAYFTLGA